MDTKTGWAPSRQWEHDGTEWTGTVDGEAVATLRSPDEVLSWIRQQAASLRLDRTQRSDALFGGDRGKAAKQLASQGESVEFSLNGTVVRAEVGRG